MSVTIISKQNQAFGSFANGAISENKPIGFPQDRGLTQPYSNLFYWANASSKTGGLIDEHPHQWFEIISFVLEGEIEHYDNKSQEWLRLNAGDVQIIRAGNGITHAEKLLPNSRIFQIWFDPNIQKTQHQKASYNDYKSNVFSGKQINKYKSINYTGDGGALQMESEGVVINKIELSSGNHSIQLKKNYITSIYTLKSNQLKLNETNINQDDFILINNEKELLTSSENPSTLFIVETPVKLTYRTYRELANL